MAWMFGWTKKAIFATTATLTLGVSAGLGTAVYFASKVEQPGDKFIIKGVVDKAMLFNDLEKELSSKSFAELKALIDGSAADWNKYSHDYVEQNVYDKAYSVASRNYFNKQEAFNALNIKPTEFQGERPASLTNGSSASDLMIWDASKPKQYFVFETPVTKQKRIYDNYKDAATAWAIAMNDELHESSGSSQKSTFTVQVDSGSKGIGIITLNPSTASSVNFDYLTDDEIKEDIIKGRLSIVDSGADKSGGTAGVVGKMPLDNFATWHIGQDGLGTNMNIDFKFSADPNSQPDFVANPDKYYSIEAIEGKEKMANDRSAIIKIDWQYLWDKFNQSGSYFASSVNNYVDVNGTPQTGHGADFMLPVNVPSAPNATTQAGKMVDVTKLKNGTDKSVRDYSKEPLDPSYIDVNLPSYFITNDNLYEAFINTPAPQRVAKNSYYGQPLSWQSGSGLVQAPGNVPSAADLANQTKYNPLTDWAAGNTSEGASLSDASNWYITQKLGETDPNADLYVDWMFNIQNLFGYLNKSSTEFWEVPLPANPVKYRPADWMTGVKTTTKDFYDQKYWLTDVKRISIAAINYSLNKFPDWNKFLDVLKNKSEFNKFISVFRTNAKADTAGQPVKFKITLKNGAVFADRTVEKIFAPSTQVFVNKEDYNDFYLNVNSPEAKFNGIFGKDNPLIKNTTKTNNGSFTNGVAGVKESRRRVYNIQMDGVNTGLTFDYEYTNYNREIPGQIPNIDDVRRDFIIKSITKNGLSVQTKPYSWLEYFENAGSGTVKNNNIETISSPNQGIKNNTTFDKALFENKTFYGYIINSKETGRIPKFFGVSEDDKNAMIDIFLNNNTFRFMGITGTQETIKKSMVSFLLEYSIEA